MSYEIRPFQSENVPPLPAEAQRLARNALRRASLCKQPIDFEIGCGVGKHPLEYCQANPERHLIAVEHTKTKFASFLEHWRKSKLKLPNLTALQCNAVSFMKDAVEPATFDRIFLLYPNPEPQARNRRWFLAPVMGRILETLKPGGTITLATNVSSYFKEAMDYAQKSWGLKVLQKRNLNKETMPVSSARTHFEKKYLERGETCFEVVFQKPL